jgi:hypothetical protein
MSNAYEEIIKLCDKSKLLLMLYHGVDKHIPELVCMFHTIITHALCPGDPIAIF